MPRDGGMKRIRGLGGGEVAFRNPYKSLYITLIYLYIPVYKGWSYC